MPRNNQRNDVSRQELQRLEARLTSLAGRTARQTSDSDELPVDAVDTVNIANDAVTEDKIADGAVTFKKLASGGTTSGGGGNYSSQAETRRSGATTTTEIYYTARPDGDGYAESEVTTSTPSGAVIERTLYYSDKFDADPDTSGDWTAYTTQPADDTAFATAKAALLAGLSDTDGTANTRGTLPVSLKMEHKFATDLLLEDYPGASAAYSVRKIRDGYTGSALRVREDSGNTEADIGFDSNGDLDTAAIKSFCDAAGASTNGYVVTWYDQSGSSNDATQSTTTQQPQIYDGSAVLTKNGQPSVRFNGDSLDASITFASSDPSSVFWVASADNAGNNNRVIASGSGSVRRNASILSDAGNIYDGANGVTGGTVSDNTQTLFSGFYATNNGRIYVDGALGATGTTFVQQATSGLTIGTDPYVGGSGLVGELQEILVYKTDQDTAGNRTGIESNINTYYTIY